MLAPSARALLAAAALAVRVPMSAPGAESAKPKPAATKPAPAGSSKPAPATTKKKPAAAAKKPALLPPPPPPPVELIGFVSMPSGSFRDGPPSGQFDDEGRRAA